MKIRKLLKTMVVTGILLIMCSVFFWGCSNTEKPNYTNIRQYLATLYNPPSDWFYMQFLDNANEQSHITPEQSYIISDQAEFEETFKEFPVSVNFDNQILLVHWEISQIGHAFELKDIILNDKTLTVKFGCNPKYHNTFGNHMTSPHLIFIAVIMRRIEFSEVSFINTETNYNGENDEHE